MKRLLLFITLLIFIPTLSYANDISLYNCEKEISLSTPLLEENGEYYICEDDLALLNLSYADNKIKAYDKTLTIYHGNDLVKFQAGNYSFIPGPPGIYYKTPSIEVNSKKHIAIDLIIMFFAKHHEISEDKIELWIPEKETMAVRGIISLPDGEVAPEGGVRVTVWCKEKTVVGASTSNSISSKPIIIVPVPNNNKKPTYTATNFLSRINRDLCQEVIIEEGQNSASYFLYDGNTSFLTDTVFFYTQSGGYWDTDITTSSLVYSQYTDPMNFNIRKKENAISGTVTIPAPADEDTEFTVTAAGTNNFTCTGIIPKDSTSATYNLPVMSGETYSLHLVFTKAKYMRRDTDSIMVNEDVADVNFSTENARKYIALLTLTEPASEDIEAVVTLQEKEEPKTKNDTKTVTIPKGERSAEVCLYDDYSTQDNLCYYTLSKEYNGLKTTGYYSTSATATDLMNSAVAPVGTKFSIRILDAFVLALTAGNTVDGKTPVTVTNSTDYMQNDINLMFASYNDDGSLKSAQYDHIESLTPDTSTVKNFDTSPSDTKVKVFAWNKNMKPMAYSIEK